MTEEASPQPANPVKVAKDPTFSPRENRELLKAQWAEYIAGKSDEEIFGDILDEYRESKLKLALCFAGKELRGWIKDLFRFPSAAAFGYNAPNTFYETSEVTKLEGIEDYGGSYNRAKNIQKLFGDLGFLHYYKLPGKKRPLLFASRDISEKMFEALCESRKKSILLKLRADEDSSTQPNSDLYCKIQSPDGFQYCQAQVAHIWPPKSRENATEFFQFECNKRHSWLEDKDGHYVRTLKG